jgi:arylsulfatase A
MLKNAARCLLYGNSVVGGRYGAVSLLVAHGILWASTVHGEAEPPVGPRPNVIVIMADDMGYGDVQCYGGKVPTPHFDRLAREGMKFTDAHSSSSVCTPTRYGLLTGRYNWRSRLKSGVLGGLSPRLIEPGRMTVGSLLQQQGYHAACFGKWHLGMDWVVHEGKSITELGIEPREQVWNVDYAKPITNGPNAVGFDEFFGISASLDMVPYTYIENDRVVEFPTEDRDFPMMLGRDEQRRRTRKGPTALGFEAEDVLPTITRKSVEYIARRAASSREGKPFFLYIPLASPHTPIVPTDAWRERSGINAYGDFIMESDATIGAVLHALEEHGLSDNTLVIATSDNGCSPQAQFAELEQAGHHPSGPLRGHKADLFEGGHRVPFVVRWPGRIGPGAASGQVVCLTDIMATLADLLRVALPDDAGEDSISFWPALRGEKEGGRDHLVSHSINGSFAIRQGPWKLLLCPDSGGWSAPRPGQANASSLPDKQLYQLDEDLGEQRNLQEKFPEKVRELTELLEAIKTEGRSRP